MIRNRARSGTAKPVTGSTGNGKNENERFLTESLSDHNFASFYRQKPGKKASDRESRALSNAFFPGFWRSNLEKLWPLKDSVQNILFSFFSLPVPLVTGLGIAEDMYR